MEETLDIQQQVPQQEDPPRKKLWGLMRKKELYTKSYEDFESQFSTPEKIDKLHKFLSDKQLYTKPTQDFKTQFFSDKQEPTPSKKKVGTVSFGETYSSPELDSETPSTGEIPTVVDYGDGEPLPNNIVDLSRKATEYSKKTKEIERTDMRGNPIPETVPDESFIGTSKKIIEDLDKQGIKKDFVDVVSDLPDEAFNDPNTSKDKLVELYKTNRIKFHQFVNEQKNRIAIKKAAFENQRNANNGIDDIDPTQMAVHVANKYLGTYEEAHPQNLDQLQDIILKKQDIIGQSLIGEERTKALERVRESYSSYINPTNPDIQAEYEQSPLKGKVDVTQYSALKTLQLFDAKKYEQAVNILNTDIQKQYTFKPEFENFQSPVAASTSVTTSDSTLAAKNKGSLSSETIDQQIGKESILRQLTELGRNNLVTQINSQQYDLEQSFNNTDNPEEKEAIKQQYVLNQGKLDEVSKNASQDNIKFPLTSKLEFDNQVKELVQDPGMGAVEYGTNKFAHGVGVGGESFEDMAVSIFGSEKDKALLGMKRMGESKWFESKTYLPEDYRSTNSPFIMQPSEALKDAAKGITGGKKLSDLSADQKQQITELVANNQSQIETVTNPKAGKSKNFFSKATLYSNTGFIGEVGAFMYKIMGAKSLGLSGKSAELLTLYNDGYSAAYNQKILEGNEEEANQYGILHGGVMLLAGTVSSKFDAVKSMLAASKSPISKQILGLGEAGWDAIVNKNKSTISKIANGVSDVVKSNAKMIGTYGVGVSIASDLADKGFFNKDISVSEIADNAKHSAIDMAIGSVGLAGIGFISHAIKNPVTLKDKATIWEIGDNKEFSKQRIDEAVAKNELTQSEGDAKKKTIDNVASLIEKVPTENSKGKPLTDNQKVKLLYNLILKEKGKEAAKDLPDNQSDKAEHIAMVADYANGIILENPTEKQLESRKNTLEKQVEGKDENGKPLLPEKELLKAKAQLEAVNDAIQRKENNVEVQAPISTGESIPLKTEEQSRNENGIVVEKPMVVPEPITVSSEPTKPQSTSTEIEPPEISFRKDSFVRARNKVGIDEFVDESKTTHIAESTKAQRTVEKWKEDGSYAEKIADIQDRASKGQISNQEKFIFAKHLADLDATVNAIKDVNSKEYDIALGEYNKALNAADAARSAAGRQLGMIPKNRGTAQTLADVMSDMMNDNKADVLTTEQKKTAEKRYEKVKEALDKESALRIEIEAEAEKLRAENALLKKQVEGKGKPKEGKVYKDGKRDFDAETKNYKDELKKLAEEYKAAGHKLGISSDGGGESFVISAKMAKVVMKIAGVKVEQMGVKLKEVTEATLKEVKDIFDGITEKDIREIIAGKYNEKKATKNDLLSQMYDLKKEQKLLFELEALENGETPKTEKALKAKNQRLKEIRDKIDALKKQNGIGKYSDESKFISAAKTRIEANKKKQKEISDKIKNKDFSEEPESKSILDNTELQKKNKKLYEEYQKSVIDKDKTLFQYEQDRIDDKIRNYNLAEKAGHYAELAFHTSKGSVAIFDQSGLLVQLIQTTGSHPWWTAKSILPALRDLVTPKWFDANMAKLKQSKYWDLFQKMDLPLYDTHSHDINFRNDLLGGDKNLMNKDIIIGGKKMSIGKAFERSTATLFNNIRVKLATEKIEELHREGKTWENSPEEFKQAARVIAEFTGHGKVHKAFTNENWNILIWSSKMLASTFNVLGLGDVVRPVSTAKAIGKGLEGTKVGNLLGIKNVSIDPKKSKGFYSSLTPQQRKFAAKEMSRFIASGATLLAAAYLKGQFLDDEEEKTTVDVNPLSTDFGTIKSGDKTVNVYGRYGSAVGAIAQIMMGVRYLGGREDVLGDKYGDKSEADVAFGKFGRGKMTPVLGLVYDYKFNDKKNYFTKEKITGMGALKQAISPLAFQDIAKDIKREDPALSIALWTLFKVYGGNVRDRRDFIEQDLKVPEWKFLNDKGLKLTKKSKESLKPVDADGKPIEVTEDKYKEFLKKREEYVRQDIQELIKGEPKVLDKKGGNGWVDLPKSKLKDIPYDKMEDWLMGKTSAANDKAMKEVFTNAVEPPKDKDGDIYTR